MNRKHVIIGVFVLIALLAAGGWFWCRKNSENTAKNITKQPQEEQRQEQEQPQQKFVTDVDMDINHWKTKETEYFTIKYPKEWYWLESEHGKNEGYSQVITNNSNFDMEKYADIGTFTGYNYSMSLDNGKFQLIPPLQDTEIVISTNRLGGVTSNSGTPRDYMSFKIKQTKELYDSAKCSYASSLDSIPLTAYCSFVDSDDSGNTQKVQTYYVSYKGRTFAYTARTTKENDTDIEPILEKIAKSLVPKENFQIN